jgi:photosystem II stability/assembly factor-like uncharacterized protein
MLSPSEGWAIGDMGFIMHYANGQWQALGSKVSVTDLRSIYMVSPDSGWIVGDHQILRYQKDAQLEVRWIPYQW